MSAEFVCVAEKGLRRLFAGAGHCPKGRMISEQRFMPGTGAFFFLPTKLTC